MSWARAGLEDSNPDGTERNVRRRRQRWLERTKLDSPRLEEKSAMRWRVDGHGPISPGMGKQSVATRVERVKRRREEALAAEVRMDFQSRQLAYSERQDRNRRLIRL